jgi:kynurenine--oxoglutarate transaminase/cysteine-S-conjugate beta-lyase/glutamine--phenylpyruvate transaminase
VDLISSFLLEFRWLTQEIGVAAIPSTAFYTRPNKHLGENFIRLCFCKEDESIEEAGRRLTKLKDYMK